MPAFVAFLFFIGCAFVAYKSWRRGQPLLALFATFWMGYNFCLFVTKAMT